MGERLDVLLTNDLAELERLAGLVDSFTERNGFGHDMAFKLNLCFDELITNTVSYGYADGTPHEIRVSVVAEGGRIVAVVEDDGKPFNPFTEAPPPDLMSDIEDRPIGGLGVFLVKQLMDETSYRREGDRNVVTLTKDLAG